MMFLMIHYQPTEEKDFSVAKTLKCKNRRLIFCGFCDIMMVQNIFKIYDREKMMEKSCGTIPYTIKEKNIYYLLIKTRDNDYCGFPKGHVEKNETEMETALRETLEETSIHVSLHQEFRYEITYEINDGMKKTVVYYLASFQNQSPKRYNDFEDFEYFLLPFNEAYQKLTFENTKQMLKAANRFLVSSIPQNALT